MHTFVHIGDTHLNPGPRNDTKRAALEQILREGSQLPDLAAWLWPGDLAHARLATDDLNYLTDYIQRLTKVAPLVLVPGNHDHPGSLDVFTKLATGWPVYLALHPSVVVFRTPTNAKVALATLPYPSRGQLVAAGTPSIQVVEAARQALDAIFLGLRAELDQSGCPLKLFLAHVNMGGSIVSSGQPNIGVEVELDPPMLARLGDIPKLANHIHLAQEVGGLTYAGSICGMDFGEIEDKTFGVLTMDDDGAWAYARRPLDVPRLFHVEGVLTRDGFDWQEVHAGIEGWVSAHPIPDGEPQADLDPVGSFTGGEVRVRVRFASAEKDALNFELVKAPFARARRIELDPIAEHSRAQRAPEIVQAQSLEDKVSAFVRASGVAYTPAVQTKLAVLQTCPDGAAFLQTLEDELSGAASSPHPDGSDLEPDPATAAPAIEHAEVR